jgi:hypothetical protein
MVSDPAPPDEHVTAGRRSDEAAGLVVVATFPIQT